MVSLPRTCERCGAHLLHYGQCPCQVPPSSLTETFQKNMAEIKDVAVDAAIAIVEECARLGLSYEKCIEHLRSFKSR